MALRTSFKETLKWGSPVYTIDGKNVLGIMGFKSYFGIWFFNGVFLTDPKKVLENAQEGKTKAMRHWKFTSAEAIIDKSSVLSYMQEAIENQKKGLALKPVKKKSVPVPEILKEALNEEVALKIEFNALSPGKKRAYCEYIAEAKQVKTKISRLEKIRPKIIDGAGLYDKYKNC